MAEELNVGKLVAEIILEAKTEGADSAIEAIEDVNKAAAKAKPELTIKSDTKKARKDIEELAEKVYKLAKEKNEISIDTDIKDIPSIIKDIIDDLKKIGEIKPEISVDIDINSEEIVQAAMVKLQQEFSSNEAQVDIGVDIDENDLIYIRDVLKQMGIEGEEADKLLSSAFSDTTGLIQYKEKIEQLSAKIDEQRDKIKTLQEWTNSSTSHSLLNNIGIESAHDDAIEKEIEALKKLENEFDQAYASQDEWVIKQVKNFQKQEAATGSAAEKQENLNKKMSDKTAKGNMTALARTVTSSLKTIDTSTSGVFDGVDELISGFSTLKEVINNTAGASKAMMITSAVAAVASIVSSVISIVTNYMQQVEQKKEEARKEAAENAAQYKENTDTRSDLTSRYIETKTKLDNLNLSRSEEIKLEKELMSIQGELGEAYDSEIEKIDLKNDSLQETLEKLQQINIESAQKYLNDNDTDIETAKNELAKTETVRYQEITWHSSEYKDVANDISKIFEDNGFKKTGTGHQAVSWVAEISLEDKEQTLENTRNALETKRGDYEEYSDEWELYNEAILKVQEDIDNIDTDKIKDYKDTLQSAAEAGKLIANNGADPEKEKEVVDQYIEAVRENISAFGALQDAYLQLSSGQSLSADTLSELTEKYPALQKYIIETGDLSLQNGEYMKKVAQDTMESNLGRIDSEKAALEAKGKMTEEEKGYYEELQAKAVIYQSQLDELNSKNFSDLTSSLSSLGSAWSQLNQGKSLDFDTTLSLINQYPQFAQAMADGSLSIENQAKVIELLWKFKKREAIASVEADRTKLVSQQNETAETIKSLKEKIMLYEKELKLQEARGMVNVYGTYAQDLVNLRKELSAQEELQKNNGTMLEQYNAQIAAINGLTIETYNSKTATEQKNEALAEELKYMEHIKALGQLSSADELAWLERINVSYSQNADERYDMELRLYNAEKAWREEQEKAIEDALNAEYTAISNNKSLDSLSKQEELDWLLRIRDQYVLNAEQAIALQIKIYEAEKALRDELLQNEYTAMNNQKSLDRLTSEQELEWLERIRATFELNAEQRMELEIKIHNLKKQLADEEQSELEKAYDEALNRLERHKKLSTLSYDLEIAYLDEIRRKYKLTAEDAADLEQKIRDLLKDKKDADISALDKLGDAVTEALKNKYEQQRKFEEDLINQSIENWKKWEDETTAAIQGQIDALDKLDEAQESEDKRREYELKRQQVELKLAYEKDDYNRKQLQKELNRLDKEEAERLLQEQRKAQKEALQQQLDEVKKQSQEQQDALQKELDAIGENYDKLTSSFNLRAETERTMMQSSQTQLVNLIKSYAPEYDLAGQSLGDSLYNGFASKYKNIETMVQWMSNLAQHYQSQLAKTANTAADNFWQTRAEYEAEISANSPPAKQDISLVVNFNEPVESPIQTQRALETVVSNLAAEIRK